MKVTKVAASSAIDWYGEGWSLFKVNPGMWIALVLIYIVVTFVLNIIPILGAITLALLTPALAAGVLYAAREADQGRDPAIEHLFIGLSDPSKRGPMLMLGALYIGIALIGFLVLMVLGGGSAIMGSLINEQAGLETGAIGGLGLIAILGLVLAFVLGMAFMYAGPLVLFKGVAPLDAIRGSFNGCMQNLVAIIVFDIITTILAFAASLPLLLGWLILDPCLFGALYASYKAILE